MIALNIKDYEKYLVLMLKVILFILLSVFVYENIKSFILKKNFSINSKTDVNLHIIIDLDEAVFEYPNKVELALEKLLENKVKFSIHLSAYYHNLSNKKIKNLINSGIDNDLINIIGGSYSNIIDSSVSKENLISQFELNKNYYKNLDIDLQGFYLSDKFFSLNTLNLINEEYFLSDHLINKSKVTYKNKIIIEGSQYLKKKFRLALRLEHKNRELPLYEFEKTLYFLNLIRSRDHYIVGDFNEIFVYGEDKKKLDAINDIRIKEIKTVQLEKNLDLFFDLISKRKWIKFTNKFNKGKKKLKEIKNSETFENDFFSKRFFRTDEKNKRVRYETWKEFSEESSHYKKIKIMNSNIFSKNKNNKNILKYIFRIQNNFSFYGDYFYLEKYKELLYLDQIFEIINNNKDTAYLKDIDNDNIDELFIKNLSNIYVFSLKEGGKLKYWYNNKSNEFLIDTFSKNKFKFLNETIEYKGENHFKNEKKNIYRYKLKAKIDSSKITLLGKKVKKIIHLKDNSLEIKYIVNEKFKDIKIKYKNTKNKSFSLSPKNGILKNRKSLILKTNNLEE